VALPPDQQPCQLGYLFRLAAFGWHGNNGHGLAVINSLTAPAHITPEEHEANEARMAASRQTRHHGRATGRLGLKVPAR
jgi:hypothetical protein